VLRARAGSPARRTRAGRARRSLFAARHRW
jgi:hypothetical protein